ncbi:hypothetical protein GPJ56_007649 [Histomonas meleagridis]|uniref:uncharacterized protein n=1 Tax=Histomonas meleagridis TaxID=135588 RepID=UPI0035596333|nr:hypothetical protein GPJ56_007649 [Histomonas meleagridis]KAH0802194.1 hypothetical protein GO595_005053 [Histomonas meleagridis]
MPYDELLNSVSDSILCKSLVHYATMIESASINLKSAIFKISSYIVKKVVNENNTNPLSNIYKAAILSLTTCNNAAEFIATIMQYESSVSMKQSNEFYDWNRSIEDVCRALGRILVLDDSLMTLTDFSTLQSVYNVLNSDVVPKVLPFETQKEMLNAMMRVKPLHDRKRGLAPRRSFHGYRESSSGSKLYNSGSVNLGNFRPFERPKELIIKPELFVRNWESGISLSNNDFLKELKI